MSLDDRSNVEDSESVKDLGETTDLLNLTHVMKMDPSHKALTLSPMEKLRNDEMNGKVEGEDEEEEYLDEEEDDEEEEEDEEDEEVHPEEEEEGEKCDEKEDILDEKRKETEEQEQSITEPDIQKKQINDSSVPDGPKKDSDPATLLKEETQLERNSVPEDKPKTLSGSRNRLSLFKRASTKGNQAEITTAGKPAADGPSQIPETREPESSSSEAQTTASSRPHSATCNLL